MERLFDMLSKDTSITLFQFSKNGKQTRNTILSQLTETVIIDMTKSSMPQKTRWHYTFTVLKEVCNIVCMADVPFNFRSLPSSIPIITSMLSKYFHISTLPPII
jgi:hypothetical protein